MAGKAWCCYILQNPGKTVVLPVLPLVVALNQLLGFWYADFRSFWYDLWCCGCLYAKTWFFYLNLTQHSVASHLQCSSKSEFQKCLMARSSCLGMWLGWLAISFYVLDASAILRIKKWLMTYVIFKAILSKTFFTTSTCTRLPLSYLL